MITSPDRTRRRSLRTFGWLLVAAWVLGACDSAPPTASGYFDDLAGEMSEFSEAITTQQEQYGSDLAGELDELHGATDFGDLGAVDEFFDQAGELAIVRTADLFSETGAEMRDLIERLSGLEPTAGLAIAHDDLLTAGAGLISEVPTATETVRNLDSIDQLAEALDGSPYATAAQRFSIACANLSEAATAAGVTTELTCPQPLVVAAVS